MESLHHLLALSLIGSLQVYGYCYRPDIPALAAITPKSNNYQSGDTISYGCTNGGRPTGGNSERSCSNAGQWTGVAPQCLDKCYRPELPAYASIIPNSDIYQSGGTVIYNCTNGGTLTGGDSERSCISGERWTGVVPLCLAAKDPKVCGIPPQAPFTKSLVFSSNKKPGDVIQQECIEGYGPQFRSRCLCTDTGRWDEHCHTSVSCFKNPVPPTNLRIERRSSSCFRVLWNRPTSYNSQTKVVGRCFSRTHQPYNEWGTISTTSTSWSYCHKDYQYYSSVRCDLRASEGDGRTSSEVSTPAIKLQQSCGDPSPPRNLTISVPSIALESGSRKWKYTVSWLPPTNFGCDSLHQYSYTMRYPTDKYAPTSLRTNSTVIYADGEQEINFSVRARNSHIPPRLSSPATKRFRTPVILDFPVRPTNFQLAATSATCMKLSWNFTVQKKITGFQHRCLQIPWTVTSATTRTTTQCGLRPHQLVTCDVRAVNGVAYSNETSSTSEWTKCAAPSEPENLVIGPPYYIPKMRKWRYVATWKAPTEINCAHLHRTPYIVRYPTAYSPKVETNSTSLVLYEDWNAKIEFSVWSKNSDGLVSSPINISIVTPKQDYDKKGKQECPKVLTAVADPTTGRGLIEHSLVGTYQRISLPIGEHPIAVTLADGTNCSLTAVIYDYNLVRRIEFEARYPLECNQLKYSVAKQLIVTTLKQNYIHIQALCKGVCTVSNDISPTMCCKNSTLTVRWPTTTTYKGDVSRLPAAVNSELSKLLLNPAVTRLPVVILNHVPPIVYPIRNKDGSSARILLKSECENSLSYNQKLDTCEK